MKYRVLIEETIVQAFEIEAESEDEAMELAEDMYREGVLVLDNASVSDKSMSVDGYEWRGF